MDRAFAYVSCSEEDSRVKVQKYCRKIYELGYIPICPRFGFVPFLDESNAEDQQGLAQMSMLLLKRCRMVVVCGNEDRNVSGLFRAFKCIGLRRIRQTYH